MIANSDKEAIFALGSLHCPILRETKVLFSGTVVSKITGILVDVLGDVLGDILVDVLGDNLTTGSFRDCSEEQSEVTVWWWTLGKKNLLVSKRLQHDLVSLHQGHAGDRKVLPSSEEESPFDFRESGDRTLESVGV